MTEKSTYLELPPKQLDDLFSEVSGPPEDSPFAAAVPTIYAAFGGRVVMAVFNGTISVANADRFTPALKGILTGEVEQVILSLKNATKLSHTAVGILVDFAAGVLGRGKQLYLYEPAPFIEQRLVELNVALFFKILRNEKDLFSILPAE